MKFRTIAALVAGALSLWLNAAEAQNYICPTPPTGDNSNACADTAFVQNTISGGTGTYLPGQVLGNGTASTAAPSPTGLGLIIDQALGSTRGSILERGSTGWGIIPPGTSGLPWVSNGTGSDPGYQALTNAGIAAMTQNAVKGAATSTAVADISLPTCSTVNSALQWTTNTGFGCAPSMARLDQADQIVTGGANVTSDNLGTPTLSSTVTIDCGARPTQFLTNNAAFTLAAPSHDTPGCSILVTNGASAGTITFSGFSVGSNTGDTYALTASDKFTLFVWEINGTAGYRWAAHQ